MSDVRDCYRVSDMTPLDVELDLLQRVTGMRVIAKSSASANQPSGGLLRPLEEAQTCHFGDGQPWPCPVHSSGRS